MSESVQQIMHTMGTLARQAAGKLATLNSECKNNAILAIADSIETTKSSILDANHRDIMDAKSRSVSGSFLDRMILNEQRIVAMANGIRQIVKLPEPVGQVLSTVNRPSGLKIEKVSTPIGVIGVIFESRPNVTSDAGALCLKAGNAAILRGGSATIQTNLAIYAAIKRAMESSQIDPCTIQLVETTDRDAVGQLLSGLDGCIDVIVPRGGKSLVARVQSDARVPVFAHLEGICHTYIHSDANPDMAQTIVLNAKLRRTGICGATETLLIDQEFDTESLTAILSALHDNGCELRGDPQILKLFPKANAVDESDWSTEYLDSVLSVKSVSGIDDAIRHISTYGSNHTDAIITEDQTAAEKFMQHVDSAIVMHNASTQFADGGEFGMGAEIGISTGKMHARGPVGIEQLTTFKYLVRGSGQIRET